MKILYPLLFILSLLTQTANAAHLYFFQQQLTIDIPSELTALSALEIEKRYGKQTIMPTYAFSNKEQDVSFAITQYSTPAAKESMNRIHQSLSTMLRQTAQGATWKKDKVYNKLNTKIAVYEYEIKGIGKYQYNITYALPVAGKLTLMSFTTTENKYKDKWLGLIRKGFDSMNLPIKK